MDKRRRLLEAVSHEPLGHERDEGLYQGDQDENVLQEAVPNDIEAAVMFLRNEMRDTCPQLPPLVCHTQLCSMIRDRTSLERGLDECRKKNMLRMFKLSTGKTGRNGCSVFQNACGC